MEEIIAKKYAQALIKTYDNATLKRLSDVLCSACRAFELEKFRDIIHSPYVQKAKKKELLMSLLENQKEFENFVDLLIQNSRIEIMPFIADILQKHLRSLQNQHKAVLYANKNLDSGTIDSIAKSLSNRLGAKLSIEQSQAKIDGIRLVVDDLGVEISFLKKKFFDDLQSHILKAI